MKCKKFNKELPTPEYKTDGAAGFDMYVAEDITVKPFTMTKINLGVGFDIPKNHYIKISLRSSAALNYNLVRSGGTVDEDYKGCLHVILTTLSDNPVTFKQGQRIAQGILIPISNDKTIEEVKSLKTSVRGVDGFGSTGV